MEVHISVIFFLNLREGETDDDGSDFQIVILDSTERTK